MNASGRGGVFLLTSSVVNGRNLYDPRKQITGATLTNRSITLGRTPISAFLAEKTTAMIRPGRIVSGLSIVRSSVTPCNGYFFSTVAVHTAASAAEGCNADCELSLSHRTSSHLEAGILDEAESRTAELLRISRKRHCSSRLSECLLSFFLFFFFYVRYPKQLSQDIAIARQRSLAGSSVHFRDIYDIDPLSRGFFPFMRSRSGDPQTG